MARTWWVVREGMMPYQRHLTRSSETKEKLEANPKVFAVEKDPVRAVRTAAELLDRQIHNANDAKSDLIRQLGIWVEPKKERRR